MQSEKQAVYGIIFSQDHSNKDRSQVLLIKRRDIPVWVLPGGGLEPGESPEVGVVRELLEETGLHTQPSRKVAEYLPVNKLSHFAHFYECQVTGGELKTGSETKQVQFFPLDKLPPLPPPFKGWIFDAVANHKELIREKTKGVSYFVLVKLLLQHPILTGRYLLTKMGIHLNS